MGEIFDKDAPQKATNLFINSSLLSQARSLKINLSVTLESALEEEVRNSKHKQWLEENKQAIENCNRMVDGRLFSDKHRGF